MLRTWKKSSGSYRLAQTEDVSQETMLPMRDLHPSGLKKSAINAPPRERKEPGFCGLSVKWPKGCRGGVAFALVYGVSTLILNIALAGWLSTRTDSTGDLVVLRRLSCQSSKTVIQVVHLLINVLATLLLVASNYCMQILNSPLREEVDLAHESKRSMFVGIPNIKNLAQISWTRRLLWLVLAISSLPVHLLWNSTIVQTLPANYYHSCGVSGFCFRRSRQYQRARRFVSVQQWLSYQWRQLFSPIRAGMAQTYASASCQLDRKGLHFKLFEAFPLRLQQPGARHGLE